MNDKMTKAHIEQVNPLTDSILQIILNPIEYIDYHAGQYLQIISGNDALSYSIANAPLGSRKYELHIRHSRDNRSHERLLAEMKQEGAVNIRLPLGVCDLTHLDPKKPILFIAGGTGFAPIKAMIEQLLAEGEPRSFELFWGARTQSDLYLDEKVAYWQTHVRYFEYFSLLSDTNPTTLAAMVNSRHPNDLHHWQIVISGPFDMVYHTRDQLLAKGALIENIFSDAFQFEGAK